MKLSLKTLVVAISVPVLLAACTNVSEEGQVITPKDLQHHYWELVQIDGQNIVKDNDNRPVRLEVGENMTANGHAGCNNFFGQAELNENQFRIEKMGMTMKMCDDVSMNTEMVMSQVLTDWSNMTLTKDSLVLENDAHTLTFKLRDWVN
ncbi:META domain-containing protein [Vibrio genomosp. F10]|uniref:Heat-shock protein HslJ n=1 Tax=Vibrio genomosp. F10 TaxID=723171 RepID=A0A1B9QV71_9VIBR|nr:META domain-containing protein [Vibrio genomosp. F10]OCH72745.1 heat-shock protein HslJ [Vibrio genomosp. F10]